MSEFNTPSGKTTTSYNIESLMTGDFSLTPYLKSPMFRNSPSFSPSFSPFFNKDLAATQPGYQQQATSSSHPSVADFRYGLQKRENSVPRTLFPLTNMNTTAINNNRPSTNMNLVYAKKSGVPHDRDSETNQAISNIPEFVNEAIAIQNEVQQEVLHIPQDVPLPPQEVPPQEVPPKKKVVKRTKLSKAACPGGCQMSFVIGSSEFNKHLVEYHKLVSSATRKLIHALHKKEAARPVVPVLCCSECYKECQTPEEAKACAASCGDKTNQLKCRLGCLHKKKPLIFKSKKTLQKHMRVKHGRVTKTTTSKMTHTCQFCCKAFANGSNLKRHLKDSHKDEVDKSAAVSSSNIPLSTVPLTTVPMSTVPLSTVPLSTVPMSTVPMSTVPLSTVPMSTVPLSTVPMSTVPLSTVPMSCVPLSTVPLSTVPMSTVPSMAIHQTSGTETVLWMPGSSAVPVLGHVSQNAAIQTASVDEILTFSQKSYDSTEGLILSQ